MRNAIEERRYDIVQFNLRRNINDPNEEIPFQNVYMTGLEYSIYKGDWKMAILFFLHSADPAVSTLIHIFYEVFLFGEVSLALT